MPGKTSPPSDRHPLGVYEGRDVLRTDVRIRKAGDGLSASIQTASRIIAQGEKVYVLLEATCVEVQYPVEDRSYPTQGGVVRTHILDAGTATFVDEDLVGDLLETQADKNRERLEREKGILQLPTPDNDPAAALRADHVMGEHPAERGSVEGCTLCADEYDQAGAE